MHILEAITPSRIGGAETQVRTITHALQRRGDEVAVFCPKNRPIVPFLTESGITPITWGTCGKVDPVTLFRLVSLIKRQKFDVIHTHLTTASLLGSWAAALAGIPSVATVHGMTEAACYRHAGHIIAVSQAVKDHLLAQGMSEEKITVVRNGILLDEYRPTDIRKAKTSYGWHPSVFRVGIFGRMSPEKGHATALEAWARVIRRHPRARLTLVGDGKLQPALRTQADQLGITGQLDFLGFQTDPRPIMAACDIVLAPSRKEGLGLAAIEAMALRRPVIAADVDGLREVVQHGTTGWLTPPTDPEALADAIMRLLNNPHLANTFGEAGRHLVEERFDAEKQVAYLRTKLAAQTHITAVPTW